MQTHKIKSISEFNNLINNETVIVKFGHEECKPCVNIAPEYEKLALAHRDDGFVFVDVDVIATPDIGRQWMVRSFPSFAIFRRGTLIWMDSGTTALRALSAHLLS